MNTGHTEETDREERLDEVLFAYHQLVEAGQAPDRQEWLRLSRSRGGTGRVFYRPGPVRTGRRSTAPVAQLASTATRGPRRLLETDRAEFGDYTLLEELGRGGMGIVYRARQKSLNRFVALKVVRQDDLASPAESQALP